MPDPDFLVEVIETTTIDVLVPADFQIVAEDEIAHNVIELEIISGVGDFEAEVPASFRLELLDGDLFVANNDDLLGTRMRQAYGVLLTNNNQTFQIPTLATRIFGFSLNGIDYVENVTLALGTGVVTFAPSPGGYTPRTGDYLLITYSE